MSGYEQTGYGDLPLFRTCDPATSKEAADNIRPKASHLRSEFVRCLRALGEPSTAQEIAAICNAAIRESVRKRAAECVEAGMVIKLGTKQCKVTKQRAAIYWVPK